MDRPYRVSLIGAGFISATHIEVLRSLPGVAPVAVVDPDIGRARALAARSGIPHSYADVGELLAGEGCDAAHVLVPPDRHRQVAVPLLDAGVHVFLEKPMAVSSAECRALTDAANRGNARLGVNQNFLFDPAFLKLKAAVESGEFGRLHHLVVWLNMPLRQLAARQFNHWMFQLPQNIVLEQAVHPLSQICDLAGPARDVFSSVGAPQELAPGMAFYDTWQVAMTCERAAAQVLLSFGRGMPSWTMTAICDDGIVSGDFINNRVFIREKTRWPDFFDSFLDGVGIGWSCTYQSCRNALDYVLSTLKLKSRSDPFFRGMQGSIEAFYAGLRSGGPRVDGAFGAELVAMCERIAADVAKAPAPDARTAAVPTPGAADVAVLGGTGFIGRHVVRRLLDAGLRVRIMARNTRILPAELHVDGLEVVSGDTARAEDVARCIAGAGTVVDLAHGGGGATWPEVRRSMVDGARTVAACCVEAKVGRLIYVSSIAALYLGDPEEVISAATGTDPQPERRGIYARGKAAAEEVLADMHERDGLPVCILRPGVVIGAGGQPFHSGLGQFVRDRHCIGWNDGNNPLPFVLVDDVADAIRHAIDAEGIIGRRYNLVGDVRFTAREYIAHLADALGRRIVFHPRPVAWLQLVEIGKWLIKLAIRRGESPFPSYRDLVSRGMKARFDCSAAKADLNWTPASDRDDVIRRGIAVHGAPE